MKDAIVFDHGRMFFFFSNRLGCLGSLAVSLAGTLILLMFLFLAFRR